MTHGDLPEPDDYFCKLISDHLAPKHLFVAEGEGANYILDVLSTQPQTQGRKAIYYADTVRMQSPGLADSLRSLTVATVEVVSNRLHLLQMLPWIFSQWPMPFHVHIAASSWFNQAAEAIADQVGIGKEHVQLERYESLSRKISCVICGGRTQSQGELLLRCSSCGSHLQVSEFYSQQDHCHLGVPSDWSKNTPSSQECAMSCTNALGDNVGKSTPYNINK